MNNIKSTSKYFLNFIYLFLIALIVHKTKNISIYETSLTAGFLIFLNNEKIIQIIQSELYIFKITHNKK